jgi:chaperonin GroES
LWFARTRESFQNKSLTTSRPLGIFLSKSLSPVWIRGITIIKGGRLKMKVMPLGDRILVKMVEMETKTAGGILIPQTAQEKTQEGIVIAVGDDESIKVKAKDRVIYDKYAGTTIKISGEEQLILKAADVLAKVES